MSLENLKSNLPLENIQNFGAYASQNYNFNKNSLQWYVLTILPRKHDSLVLPIYIFKSIHLKIKSRNISKCSLLEAKLLIPLQKEGVKMVLFYFLQQNITAHFHIIFESFILS